MKGEKWLKILQFIDSAPAAKRRPESFLKMFFPGSKGNYGTLRKYAFGMQSLGRRKTSPEQEFHNLLYRLRTQGFIETEQGAWTLSRKGKEKMKQLSVRQAGSPPPPDYQKTESDELTIISYDIPEKKKRYRPWLRTVLKNLDFTMLHKSVWIGKQKLPKTLIYDLKNLRLIAHIEIFAVTRTGSITKIS